MEKGEEGGGRRGGSVLGVKSPTSTKHQVLRGWPPDDSALSHSHRIYFGVVAGNSNALVRFVFWGFFVDIILVAQ